MTTQTGGKRVRAFQPIPRLFFMIKMKIFTKNVPSFWDMAEVAVFGEGFVGN
jgi:hypothetical protein